MRITFVLIGLLLFFGSCKNSEKETPNGLKFRVLKEGDGVLPKKNEIMVFQMVTRDSKDSLWGSSYEKGLPGFLMVPDSSELGKEDGMQQMFRMLSKGDSVEVKMPIKTLFKDYIKAPIPATADSTLDVFYYIHVDDIMTQEKFTEYRTNLMEDRKKSQVIKDDGLIKEYLQTNNISALRDTSGIHYVVHTTKGKAKPTATSCVQVSYEGKFLATGQTFDKNADLSFPLNGVILGWQIGLPLMGVGDSATFFIPSGLAYGPSGFQGAIPPDAILIFNVGLKGIGGEYDPNTRSCK